MATWQPSEVTAHVGIGRRDRRTMLVVAAVAGLLLVGGLVTRGTVGLTRAPGERLVTVDPTTGRVTSGGVDLAASAVQPMFPDVHLVPGVPVSSCIEIAHTGQVDLDTVALQLDTSAASTLLLDHLQVSIERGPAGVDPGCVGFVAEADVARGRLADLAEPPDPIGWSTWRPTGDARASYRFTVVLPAEDAVNELQGTRTRVDFFWVATAQPVGDELGPRLLFLTLSFARDALLPLLMLLVLAVLFLGVQDRIDRRDPKLAMAAVHEEPRTFRSATGGRS